MFLEDKMRKLLNTIYVTNDLAYLSLDSENLVIKIDEKEALRIPFDNVEAIVCFSYLGCSPMLMGKCVSKLIPISFISPQGKFLAKVCGETKGNVFLRVQQIDVFRKNQLTLAQNTVAAKISNCIQLIRRSQHDNIELRSDNLVCLAIENLSNGAKNALNSESLEELLGIEGSCAKTYFSAFSKLFTQNAKFNFSFRNKRPPLDPINAVLSFIYTIYNTEFAAALEVVGLDSYIGYYHSLRSGRESLACDLLEECRCIVERFAITLINLRILNEKDFDFQISGAVYLNEYGRKKVLSRWQEKKRENITHPYLRQKIQLGLLPYVQANLLAKFIRGDIEEYPPYLLK